MKRYMLSILPLFLALCLMAGCGGRSGMHSRLAAVDSIVDSRYDSALTVLRGMDTLQMRRSDRMYLELLRAKAMNKASVPFTSDSVMRRVARYYDRHGSPNQRLLAHYLLGCVYRDLRSAPRALEEYQRAVSQADTTRADCDLPTLMRVHSQMSKLYMMMRLSEHALKEDSIASQVSCALQENRTLVFWNEDSTLQGEDKYLRLDYVKGHLQSGILCATSDEIEEAREGYPCGFFALPLSHIKNHGDTIYFSIVMPRGENFYRARPFRISPESGLIKPDSDELWENEDDWEHNYIPYLVKYGCQDTISIRYKMYMKGDSLLLYNILLGNNYGSSGHITFKKMNPLSQSQ